LFERRKKAEKPHGRSFDLFFLLDAIADLGSMKRSTGSQMKNRESEHVETLLKPWREGSAASVVKAGT
jgi:hypothetical protein